MRKKFGYFSLAEILIWVLSAIAITVCFFAFRNTQYHYLAGSLIGITALIFTSKGNPVGQVIVIIFSVFYGIISYSFAYYGEMITYLGMSAPIAVIAVISWIRNPYKGDKKQVKINNIRRREWVLFAILTVAVTVAFFFILRALKTSNLIVSTLSVTSSFSAAYLTARRSRFYAIGYGINDIVLIVMWCMASYADLTYLPMVVCFTAFFVLDLYGFINWSRMNRRQRSEELLNTSDDNIKEE